MLSTNSPQTDPLYETLPCSDAGRAAADLLHRPGGRSGAPAGFRALFNGKDLSGWYGLNPHSVAKLEGAKREENLQKQRDEFASHWRVENGELVNVGTGPLRHDRAKSSATSSC